MNCETIRQLGIADEYRAGRLSVDEVDAYEEHYFGCARCFDDLQFRDRVAEHLREEGARLFPEELRHPIEQREPAPSAPDRPTHRPSSGRVRWWNRTIPGPSWAWGLGLVATSVFVAAMVGTQVERADRTAHLADVSAYPYVASELRDDSVSATFEEAMTAYAGGDYATAVQGLEACTQEGPDEPDVWFYLGVSQLLLDRTMAAQSSLQAAVRLSPSSSVYRWYLAQAMLRAGNRTEAARELETLARGSDAYAAQARRLRFQLQRL